ncbi:MAG: lasso peptide isopeptide bond-forming cyclase [Anaerolineae bacterium]|nr:lasso peptide isopeptide bond-forming cyclase [Anaerolineae bacterium]
MSAIAGIFFLDGRPAERAYLERMLESVAHRGPDGVGFHVEGAVGLGQRMLWTTPESLYERPPLAHHSGDIVITADARIDNREELIEALGTSDRPRGELTDSALILDAYERWGERCPEKLLGDFAFAIWDRGRKRLFCARDHFGVKPFYYYRSARLYAFASEIKALLSLPEVPCALNEVRVADYLEVMWEDKTITFYQDIFRLPPGHSLTVTPGQVSVQPYWALAPSHRLRLSSDNEYAEAYREVFTDAVRCRLRSAFPVGSMLSGGLDSSSITCVARGLLAQGGNRRLHTFSAIFDDVPECDERPFIHAVLAQGDAEAHFVHGDRLSPLADLDRVLWHEDEPYHAPNLFLHWGLWDTARQHGVRVLLDGFMGDTAVSHGTTYVAELARSWRWLALAREVKAAARANPRAFWRVLWYYVRDDGLRPLVPEPVRQAWRVLRGRKEGAWLPGPLVNPNFAQRVGLADRIKAQDRDRARRWRSEKEKHFRDLTSGLIPSAMEWADKVAAFSIEARYPFLDRRLVEFCLALPPVQKYHDGWSRMIVRRGLAGILPEKVQWRQGKGNVAPILEGGLLAFERERLEDVMANAPDVIGAYIDVATLRESYRQYVLRGGGDTVHPVWLAVVLDSWLRRTGLGRKGESSAIDKTPIPVC